ncbi:uncharacterized protein LOC131028004 [Cryptomeria japonica]|uniref:uncharacterized protein LOC131028004 n=1 Tax=Cryptomeria japonica TaxID=3369 RepID=UPI0027DA16B4|nr:uncharacterized protein LOC131028004 [Cryptomeria japonica]
MKRGPNTHEKGGVNQGGNKKVNSNTNFTNLNTRQNFDKNRSGRHPGPKDGYYNCGENHYASKCPQYTTSQRGGNQQGASQHQIRAMVDNRQADFQASPIHMTSKIFGQSVSILIDTGATKCFINPKVVSILSIRLGYMSNTWMVQYGNQAEKRIDSCLFCSDFELPCFQTQVNLYVTPLGSYDVILGINWLIKHKGVVNCEDKVVSCIDDFGNLVEIFGSQKPFKLRHISAMQLKKAQRKGCSIFSIIVSDVDNSKKSPKDYVVLREFLDIFPEDLTKLPPKREFDFSIEILPRTKPQSKAPYRMTTT